jgi:ParB-like chromosome segregation protein Spo0J
MNLKIEYVPPSELKAYENNSRTHSEQQVEQICNSIREFGFVNPILIGDDNTIIAGHGRLMAANALGLDLVPVVRVSGLSDRQRRALVIADNKIAMNAGWDFAKLGDELSALLSDDFDPGLTGFNEQELDALLKDDIGILPTEWGEPEKITVSAHVRTQTTDQPPKEGNFQDEGVAYKTQFGVIVICESEADQKKVFEQLSQEGYSCKIVVT